MTIISKNWIMKNPLESLSKCTKLYTSYFSKWKQPGGVSIALKTPHWYGPVSQYPSLMPTQEILFEFKRSHDEVLYTRRYENEILAKLDPFKVLMDLARAQAMLCWEGSDKFCHRHIVGQWLRDRTGIEVVEY